MGLIEEIATKELVKATILEYLRENLTINVDTKSCYCCNTSCSDSVDLIVKVLLEGEVISEDVVTL